MRPLAAQLHGSRDLGHGVSLAVNPRLPDRQLFLPSQLPGCDRRLRSLGRRPCPPGGVELGSTSLSGHGTLGLGEERAALGSPGHPPSTARAQTLPCSLLLEEEVIAEGQTGLGEIGVATLSSPSF